MNLHTYCVNFPNSAFALSACAGAKRGSLCGMEELRRGAGRMGERATAARDAMGDRAQAAKDAMGDRASAAKEAVGERATAAKEATAEAIAHVKPRLRGVSHEWAFFASLLLGAALIVLAQTPKATLAVGIY